MTVLNETFCDKPLQLWGFPPNGLVGLNSASPMSLILLKLMGELQNSSNLLKALDRVIPFLHTYSNMYGFPT